MNKKTLKHIAAAASLFAILLTSACASIASFSKTTILEQPQEEEALIETVAAEVSVEIAPEPEKYIRGIHLSAWISGPNKHRTAVIDLFDNTELNTAVIDIKEMEGEVYIDGVKSAEANGTYVGAIKNIKEYLARLKERNIYTIARIVVFKDDKMPRKKPSMAVKNPDGSLWTDRKNMTWFDPYSKDAWEYTFEICERAVELGFEEIQFDYIRFPSDGNTKNCVYSNKDHSSETASKAIVDFLKEANKRLKSKGAKISIDVFGGTTTSDTDMGIGQKIVEMTEWVDYVSPMVYPSHYYKGEFGLSDPNKEPYIVVYKALEGAMNRIPREKLRPWLQDFTMFNYPYGKEQIRAQIQACYDLDIPSWLLWNARCVYTRSALKGNDAEEVYEKSDPPTPEMIKTAEKLKAEEEKKIQEELAAAEEKIIAEVESKQKKSGKKNK
ncbi:MAG: putative glycoside hydrolase [Endomicrobia bacterium]|nr:putative glycoside hydrolase [Endomicrobiia bacterium]